VGEHRHGVLTLDDALGEGDDARQLGDRDAEFHKNLGDDDGALSRSFSPGKGGSAFFAGGAGSRGAFVFATRLWLRFLVESEETWFW
jgi:hypothetical protein